MFSMKKRLLSGLLAMLMMLSLLPAQAWAESGPETPGGSETVYTVWYTHVLHYTVDGKGCHAEERCAAPLKLTAAELANGYDMAQLAYSDEPLEVDAPVLTLENIREYETWGASINYTVKSGWAVVHKASGGEAGVSLRTVFTGSLTDLGLIFVPADVVRLTIHFEYSRTGGMAGAPAADSVVVEIMKTEGSDITVTRPLPSSSTNPVKYDALKDFRIVLNPEPLNAYLVNSSLAQTVMSWPAPLTPPQLAEIQTALENGDFNVRVDNTGAKPVYWVNDPGYQSSPTGNPHYNNNRYSTGYNMAWDNARKLENGTYFNATVSETVAQEEGYGQGADALQDPVLTVTINEAQWERVKDLLKNVRDATTDEARAAAQKTLDDALTVTVYYRRNASFYKVEHLVPANLVGTEKDYPDAKDENNQTIMADANNAYKVVFTEYVQGRVGALTNAKDSPAMGKSNGAVGSKPGDSAVTNDFDFNTVTPQEIPQLVIGQRDSGGNPTTTVQIKYKPADKYRVIFDTDDSYIPRQLVGLDDSMVFNYAENGNLGTLTVNNSPVSEYHDPTRTGYTFQGWGYQLRDGVGNQASDFQNEDGKWCRPLSRDGTSASFSIRSIIGDAYITNSNTEDAGIKALYLCPIWAPAEASVRVVFWVEDLDPNRYNDAKVTIQKHAETDPILYSVDDRYKKDIVTNTTYSNMGSFTFSAETEKELELSVDPNHTLTGGNGITVDGTPLAGKITSEFASKMGKLTAYNNIQIDAANFYQPDRVIATMTGKNAAGEITPVDTTTVDANGTTVINVYYTRKIYTAEFIYCGNNNGQLSVATDTGSCAKYDGTISGVSSFGTMGNALQPINNPSTPLSVPQVVTIQAKYGADLTEVWPAARGETVSTTKENAGLVSWTATSGPYNAAFRNGNSKEPTLIGVYKAMDADIIPEPDNPRKTHYFYAFWYFQNWFSYYRYNHCYEVPGLDAVSVRIGTKVKLVETAATEDDKDYLYLVSTSHEVFKKYGFTDLLKAKKAGNKVVFEGETGYDAAGENEYYAVRIFGGKCYAVANRKETVSTNSIASQNPSARLHLSRVENNVTITINRGGKNETSETYAYAPDHSSEYGSNAGISNDKHDGGGKVPKDSTDPYDLYFYYTRDKYTITYSVPVNNNTAYSPENSTELTLGTIEVPYGAVLSQDQYGFALENQGIGATKLYNNQYSQWAAVAPTVPVCPDRASDGTKEWTFSGWFLNRACTATPQWGQMITGNVRLYAGWNIPTYTITFDYAGGTDTATPTSQSIRANMSFTAANGQIPRPLRNGYTLKGWVVVDEDGRETDFSFDTPITKDMQVKATWQEIPDMPAFYYKVYHLTEDDPGNGQKLPANVTPKDDKNQVKEHTTGKDTWYILKEDTTRIDTPYHAAIGSTLWLAAAAFPGYVSHHPNHSYVLEHVDDVGTSANNPLTYFFYYDKTQTKTYTLDFVLAGTENKTGDEKVTVYTYTGEADEAQLTPHDAVVKELTAKGYMLVNSDNNGGYTKVENAANLIPLAGKTDTSATYLVMPIEFSIRYDNSISDSAAQAALNEIAPQNRTNYTTRDDTFSIQNPKRYIKGSDGWYKFTGWSMGSNMASADTIDKMNLTIDSGSVGNLTFTANWEKIAPQLTVSTNVSLADGLAGVTAPDATFSFTATLPASASYADVLAYKTSKDGTMEKIENISNPLPFSLNAGESVSFYGLAAEAVTVQEDTSSENFQSTLQNYWTVDAATKSIDIFETGTQTLSFTNTYHATVTESFQVTKNLAAVDGVTRMFEASDSFNFRIASSGDNPLPNQVGSESFGRITISGGGENTDKPSATGQFDPIRFDKVGTYIYTIREERPDASQMVPAMSYDATIYQVTVVVSANGPGLAKTVKLAQRDPGSTDYGDQTDYTSNAIQFTNTYDPNSTTSRFSGRKVYKYRDENGETLPMPTGERAFKFTVYLDGSHNVTQEEAEAYHRLSAANEKNQFWKDKDTGSFFSKDDNQPKPQSTTVSPGENGVIMFPGIEYNRDALQGSVLGRVYKYTVREVIPDGARENDNGTYTSAGITYTNTVSVLYCYVHLHSNADNGGNYLKEGPAHAESSVLYAEILGDRNTVYTNTYLPAPVSVNIGGKLEITGRSFQSGDSFPFALTCGEDAPKLETSTVTVSPSTGSSADVSFGEILFDEPGTYTYTMTQQAGNLSGLTYDTAPKTLTVTVEDDGSGQLKASMDHVTWVNRYSESTTPILPPVPPSPSEPDPKPGPEPDPEEPAPEQPPAPQGVIPFPDTMILDDIIPLAAPHLNVTDHYAYLVGYADGTVRPEQSVTRAEAATIFFRLMLDDYRAEYWATENSFTDVSAGDWYNNAVSTCAKAGLLGGYADGTFRPNATITRAEFAAIASRFLSDDAPGYDYFTDTVGHWAYVEVARAVYSGWLKGEGRLFRPDDELTRSEIVTIVNRMINRFPDKENLLPEMSRWADNPEDAWYYEGVQEATNSHDYEPGDFFFAEVWSSLLKNRDWAALEKEWATAYGGGAGEVAPDLFSGEDAEIP